MAKTKSEDKTSKKNTDDSASLSNFISDLSANIGFLPSKGDGKKDKFDPFSIENLSSISSLYGFSTEYQKKNNSKEMIIPVSVTKTASGKKIKFNYEKEIKQKIFDEIVEEKSLTNFTLDESQKRIEISKIGG